MLRIRHVGVADEGLIADEALPAWEELGWELVVDDPEPEPVWTPVTVPTDDDLVVAPVTPSTPTPSKPSKGKES